MTREEAKEELIQSLTENHIPDPEAVEMAIKALEQEPKTGHWIGIDEEPHEDYECDRCGYVCSTFTANIKPSEEYKYCPNCGIKMIEPQESEE